MNAQTMQQPIPNGKYNPNWGPNGTSGPSSMASYQSMGRGLSPTAQRAAPVPSSSSQLGHGLSPQMGGQRSPMPVPPTGPSAASSSQAIQQAFDVKWRELEKWKESLCAWKSQREAALGQEAEELKRITESQKLELDARAAEQERKEQALIDYESRLAVKERSLTENSTIKNATNDVHEKNLEAFENRLKEREKALALYDATLQARAQKLAEFLNKEVRELSVELSQVKASCMVGDHCMSDVKKDVVVKTLDLEKTLQEMHATGLSKNNGFGKVSDLVSNMLSNVEDNGSQIVRPVDGVLRRPGMSPVRNMLAPVESELELKQRLESLGHVLVFSSSRPEACSSCLNQMKASAPRIRPKRCDHVFHIECLVLYWAEGLCPVCRCSFAFEQGRNDEDFTNLTSVSRRRAASTTTDNRLSRSKTPQGKNFPSSSSLISYSAQEVPASSVHAVSTTSKKTGPL